MTILQARRYLTVAAAAAGYQPKDADLTAVAVSGLAGPWTAYTPTITAGSGTLTTVSATGRYLNMGKLTFVQVAITITTNGTAAGSVRATLPNTATAVGWMLTGRENGLTAKLLQGFIGPGSPTLITIVNYDNTYPGASGASIIVSGCYENA